MTSDELRKLADEGDAIQWYGPGVNFTDALREAADEIDRIQKCIAELKEIIRKDVEDFDAINSALKNEHMGIVPDPPNIAKKRAALEAKQ